MDRYKTISRMALAVFMSMVLALAGVAADSFSAARKAWASSDGTYYVMIYKNPGEYKYTLVLQNDNAPDNAYGGSGALVKWAGDENAFTPCSAEPGSDECSCSWSSLWLYGNVADEDITRVVVRDKVSPHSTEHWFGYMSSCKSFDLAKLDTSKVCSMRGMFSHCSSIESLDLRSFNTANVRELDQMFSHCASLKSINLSSFNTAKVTDMSYMFDGCEKLTALDLSSFDMRNVQAATSMFPAYSVLSTIEVGGLGSYQGLFPEPDYSYVEGATGKWVDEKGDVYKPDQIPVNKAAVYKAQRGYSVNNLYTSLSEYSFDYTGYAIKPKVTVEIPSENRILKEGTDYAVTYTNNVNVGTATATIKGKGNYGGVATETFSIYPLYLWDASVSRIGVVDYTGKALYPSPIIKINGLTLKAGRDYKATYYSNKNVGNASIYIEGTGNFDGDAWASFVIAKRAKQPMVVKASKAKTAKAKVLKKKAVTLSKAISVKKAKGSISYQNVSNQKATKKFLVNAKSGKITIPKSTKKGTYKVKIKVTAAGNSKYKAGSKTVVVKVKVK